MTQTAEPVDWTLFLRALADSTDSVIGAERRDLWLRDIGSRIAAMRPLRHVPNMETLLMEVNDLLAEFGWGHASIDLQESDQSLMITHADLPRLGAAGDPPGTWLTPVLEGLYTTWLGQLPGADAALSARRMRVSPDVTLLRYARHVR